MSFSDQFFRALDVAPGDRREINAFAERSGVPVARLRHYNDANILPSGEDLPRVLAAAGITELELMLAMGRLSRETLNAIQANAATIAKLLEPQPASDAQPQTATAAPRIALETDLGRLYQGDCMDLMPTLDSDSVDMIFADPPFNLKKLYPSSIDDNLKTERYLEWCESWLTECIRLLKPGGALFVWNLPRWNAELAAFLNGRLSFVHWIAVDIKYSLPIQRRLYPSHYSLLYYVKGPQARVFHPDRLPMQVCPHCAGDLRDYGGYKAKMNPKGVNLSDVWWDVSPVRHAKYKRRNGANELPLKVLDRVIELSTDEGDLVFDPFGGAGTTYMAAELKARRWLGIEIGPTDDIVRRFTELEQDRKILANHRKELNALFPTEVLIARERTGWWTTESIRNKPRNVKNNLNLG
ncbi:site-specific DNA-methyltransferase [Thiohalocapsa halophila]|uniref:site-specific DNA-methyltransferase (adenine-specific) n=1 Tax=Thiohalocapsa halophila TaxID=69359 RepID=A0ABS1CPF0_9GAMM|nr:site-specific DNA-methyltransferase [Thiohalocapsa halophila]MBK1633698.1 site-specific DNA-methyltransferase [Thiohalocapsa halophila]